MKKLSLVICTVLGLFISLQVNAQNTRYDDDKTSEILEKLWFGTSFGNFGITNTSFSIGASPIVGYKIMDGTSLGLRVPVDYFFIKDLGSNGEVITHNDWDLGIGVFARQKLFFNIFAHLELNTLNIDQVLITGNGLLIPNPDDNTKALTQRINRQEANIGFGYSAGNGGIAYEISLMYDMLADRTQPFAPLLIRAGANYNF